MKQLVSTILFALSATGCGEAEVETPANQPAVGQSSPSICGNGVKEGREVCDGPSHGNVTCQSLGLGEGNLTCETDCQRFDTSHCQPECQKDCRGRVCGPDPLCGLSCGRCPEGECNEAGRCVTAGEHTPVILSFSSNVNAITEGESIILTAVVTDPDGIDDLIGGTVSHATGATYGAFVTTAQEGSYSLTLSWDNFDQVETIEFEQTANRILTATFFDVSGNTTTQTLTVTFHCQGIASCNGGCTDLDTDWENCGQCGTTCELGPGMCEGGTCIEEVCQDTNQSTTCHNACRAAGKQCVEWAYNCSPVAMDVPACGWEGEMWLLGSCSDQTSSDARSLSCCCR